MKEIIINFIIDNWDKGVCLSALLYEVLALAFPTEKNKSVIAFVIKTLNFVIGALNAKKGGGTHLVVFFMLCSFAAIGQQNFNARSVRYTPQDTVIFCLTQPCVIGTVVQNYRDSILYEYRDTTHTIKSHWRPLPGSGGVYYASAPITLTGRTFGIPLSTNSFNGYLSASDHTLFSSKESPLTFSPPLFRTINNITIQQSNTTQNGYLSNTDWNMFNVKENALTFTGGLTRTANSVSWGGTIANTTTISGSFGIGFGTAPTGSDKFRITGLSSTSTDKAFHVENSSSTNLFSLFNDGEISGRYFVANNPQTIFGYQANVATGGILAIGISSSATGTESHAIGQNATSSGTRSLVVTANNSTGSGDFSTTIGQSLTNTGQDGVVIGTSSSNTGGFGAIAIGTLNQVTQDGATAIGYQQKATGIGSFEMGVTSGLCTNSTANSLGLGWGSSTTPDILFTQSSGWKVNGHYGTVGKVLVSDSTLGAPRWSTVTAAPAGLNKQVQFNDSGVLGASNQFTFDKNTGILETNIIQAISGGSNPISVAGGTAIGTNIGGAAVFSAGQGSGGLAYGQIEFRGGNLVIDRRADTNSQYILNTAVLSGGTVTVNNTNVSSTSIILITGQEDAGVVGFTRVSSRVNGTSFTITSSSNLDTSTIGWIIIN